MPGAFKAAARGTSALVMPEQCKQKHDRQRNAEHPEQCAFTKAHDVLLSGCDNNFAPPEWFRGWNAGQFGSAQELKSRNSGNR
jgi:hypothetical protein